MSNPIYPASHGRLSGTIDSRSQWRRRALAKLMFGILAATWGGWTLAADATADKGASAHLEWHGFGTLGLARSSSDQAHFLRDLSQPDGSAGNWTGNLDSVLGLQFNAHINEQFEGVVQVVSRYRFDGTFRPELQWAFAKHNPSPNLSLRAGRLGTEFYMLADSRLVGYSSLTVRPSGDFFAGLPFYHLDGVDIQATRPLGAGLIKGKLFTGVLDEKLTHLGTRIWDVSGGRMSGGHLDYQTGPWQWRAGYAQIRFTRDLPMQAEYDAFTALGYGDVIQSLSMAGKVSRYYSLGAIYDEGPLQVQLMLSRTTQESLLYEDGHAGYLMAGYRLGAFTPYAGYSWWNTTPKSREHTPPMPGVISLMMANTHSDTHTSTLGLRWDFRENMALKAQWDRVRGTPGSIFPVRGEQAGWTGKTDVLSLTLDFVF